MAHRPLWALIVGGVIGLFRDQSVLPVEPLSVSRPFIVIVDLIANVALGVWPYVEQPHPCLANLGLD